MPRALALIGVLLVAIGAAIVARGEVPSTSARPAPNLPAGASTAPASLPPTLPASAEPTPLTAIPPGYRIQIPRVGIDLEILEGDVDRDSVQQRTPESYAFHLPGTGIPGSGLNTYIYAHARRGMFITLWNVALGDEVWISTPDGRALRYVVSEIERRVPPSDVNWTAATPPERLTLQTSTGPNPGDPRFVVIARPS